MTEPWLTIIGIGEDGLSRLSEASRKALAKAEIVFGGERHLRLADIGARVQAVTDDQALALLCDPTDAEVTTLKQFRYSTNVTALHTDGSALPRARGARASWNYTMPSCGETNRGPVVTYWMNRLQGLQSRDRIFVTLNDHEQLDSSRVVAVMDYEHPIYTPEAVHAQSRLGAAHPLDHVIGEVVIVRIRGQRQIGKTSCQVQHRCL